MKQRIAMLETKLAKLSVAVSTKRSEPYCLKLWSDFVRSRDERCLACGSKKLLSAHHVFRKSVVRAMRFATGNGITLCGSCHEEPHDVFNRKANLQLPMDAEGGENLELVLAFLHYLVEDARSRGLLRDDFYYFSDQDLIVLKKLQSVDPELQFPGSRLEQACLIWDQTPHCMLEAIFNANVT
jgi:hypothetical protein